ncbi:MAG: hypothetical protein DRN53_08550 [Thermoprotei archaeon]|nr:MAG: hypothetical protein DRN53_08550 [Thermoprotei archaeon]
MVAIVVDEDFLWYISSPRELEKYCGMHVAIWKKHVVGYGRTAKEAYEMAKRNEPESDPLLVYIPEDEAIIL